MTLTLNDNQKVGMFKKLASASLYDVGMEYGLDKHYSTPRSIKTKVYTIYKDILNNPEKYAMQEETLVLVQDAVSSRAIKKPGIPLVEKKEDTRDIKDLITDNRDLAARLTNKKLLALDKSKKALDNVSLSQLGTIFGILFDKGQIIQGQATEHVALMGKIDSSLSAEDKLSLLLNMREMVNAEKAKV